MARSVFRHILKQRFSRMPSGFERSKYAERLLNYIQKQHLDDFEKLLDKTQRPPKRVIIVGAGFAGLSAAYFLSQYEEIEITLFEARDRVGGRVLSLDSFANGRIIEGGAELIGTNHSLWIKLARRFGLSMSAISQDDDFSGARLKQPIYLNGEILNDTTEKEIFDGMEFVFEEMNKDAEKIEHAYEPWLSPEAEYWDRIKLSDWLDTQVENYTGDCDKKLLRDALEVEFACNNAVPTDKQSYLGNLSMVKGGGLKKYWDDSEIFRCANGNQSLAHELTKRILAKKKKKRYENNRIMLNNPVKKIEQKGNEVWVTDKWSNEPYVADFIILAVPPTTWKHIDMELPVKPEDIQMGDAVKFLSKVRSRFWIDSRLAPSGFGDNVGMMWEGTDNQTLNTGQEIELSVFAGGKNADAALAAHKSGSAQGYFTHELGKIYRDYATNTYATRFEAWPTEQWTGAGYSFPRPGEVCTALKKLNEPFNNTLYFAGEHTCTAFFGYMEGGLQSGMRVAKKIMDEINPPKQKKVKQVQVR